MPSGRHHRQQRGAHAASADRLAAAAGPDGPRSRLVVGAAAAVAAVAVLATVVAFTTSGGHHHGASGPSSTSVTSASTTYQTTARAQFVPSAGAKLQVPVDPPKAAAVPSAPVRVQVPSLHITSSLESLGLLPDGTMKPPSKWGEAGWYSAGTYPGAVGPAIIAGHIDSKNGPGIFLDLGQIKVGARVVVTTKTKQTFRFTVTDIKQYPKDKFPVAVVYGPTPVATLRLITCTGTFNRATHHYRDNLVVTSVLDQ